MRRALGLHDTAPANSNWDPPPPLRMDRTGRFAVLSAMGDVLARYSSRRPHRHHRGTNQLDAGDSII